MPAYSPDVDMSFWTEGSQVQVTLDRTSTTDATITWTLPSSIKYYDGVLILIKTSELDSTNYPEDGVKYTSSQNLAVPADQIGTAVVVGAFYGDKLSTSLNVTGLDPNSVYFVGAYAVTNTLQYYTDGTYSYPLNITGTYAGDIPTHADAPVSPGIGEVYFNTTDSIVYMWTGTAWIAASTTTVPVGDTLPVTGADGYFFYQTTTRKLFVWATGVGWTQANTNQNVRPNYDKIGVGSDGSTDELDMLISTVKRRLGWPTLCVELEEGSFIVAAENAIQEFRRRADNAYKKQYFTLTLEADQEQYYLNDPSVGTNKITEVIMINRLTNLGLITQGENGIYAQAFLNQFYAPGIVDVVTIHMIAQLGELFAQIFAGYINFKWDEKSRLLTLYRRIYREEPVLIETAVERTKQELILDRYAGPWIEQWCLAECLYMLGMIRAKYSSLPGAGGGIQLNGSELISEANAIFEELRRQVNDFEVGNGGEFGQNSFIIG